MTDIKQHILKKLSSGQWLMTIMVIFTYCIVIVSSVILAILGRLQTETFLALFAGFAGLALYIAKSYFERDRKQENGGNGQ